MVKGGSRSARNVRAVCIIVPRMRRSDDGGMKRYDSIRCCWVIFSFSRPWRTIAFNFGAFSLLLLLRTFHCSTFFFQCYDLLRGIVASNCLLVTFPTNFRHLRAVLFCLRIDCCPIFGDNFSQVFKRDLLKIQSGQK